MQAAPPVAAGHKAGAKALRRVLEHALDIGIKEVTAYAFSTENWDRPTDEVHALMDLFIEQIETQVPDMHARGARIRFLGSRAGVKQGVARVDEAEALTAGNERMTLYIAFNYGGRQEILDVAAGLAAEWGGGGRRRRPRRRRPPPPPSPPTTSVATFYAPEMHDPELLIRTSRRAAHLELPLAARLQRALLQPQAVARLHRGRLGRGAGRLRPTPAALRGSRVIGQAGRA